MKNKNLIVFGLFVSEFGDGLFLSSLMIFLLHQGFSVSVATFLMLILTLPIILGGRLIGRFSDKIGRNPLPSLSLVSLAIAGLEVLLIQVTDLPERSPLTYISTGSILFLLACFYHSLQICLSEYVIPKIWSNEKASYSNWELIRTTTALLAGITAFFILKFYPPAVLVWIDMITFVFASALLLLYSPEKESTSNSTLEAVTLSNNQKLYSSQNFKWAAILWTVFAFTVGAVSQNFVQLGRESLKLNPSYLSLIYSITHTAELVGAYLFRRVQKEKLQHPPTHISIQNLLVLHAIPLTFALYSVFAQSVLPGLLAIILISLLAPSFNIQTKVYLRSQFDKSRIGEIFGSLRTPRAIATMVGTYSFSISVEKQIPHYGITVLLAVLFMGYFLLKNTIGTLHEPCPKNDRP